MPNAGKGVERRGVKRAQGGDVQGLGCSSKSGSLCIPVSCFHPHQQGRRVRARERRGGAGPGGYFEFDAPGKLGMQLRQDCYPLEIERVDEGSAAYEQGVPQNSVIVRVNGQRLSKTDGKDVKERVRKMLKERPLTLDVVLREAAGPRPLAGEHPPGAQRLAKGGPPAVPGEASGAGADAAGWQAVASASGAPARAAPGLHRSGARSAGLRAEVHGGEPQEEDRMDELISGLTDEEYVTVFRVLAKLDRERCGGERRVFVCLRALASSTE